VAGGSGARFGGAKQFELLGDRRVLDWSVAAARAVADRVVLVVPEGMVLESAGVDVVVPGGAARSDSVRAGLAVVADDAEIIVVHDAARPLATPELFEAVVAEVRAGADAAVPGIAVTDTVKRVSNGRVVETLDRGALVAVQTPQAFEAALLMRAHASSGDATDDAALVEAMGGSVMVVPGEPANIKITGPEDLARARGHVAAS